jgi:nickel/cobalt transporter (NiCoT) family protein
MQALPTDALALLSVVFALGLRHGLDADHLAAIDSLTRFNARERPRLARACGALFSLGHGAVVVAIALAVAALAPAWTVPEETEHVGAWISIAFLALLGTLNIAAVFSTRADEVVRPVGLKGKWLAPLQRARSPWLVALVGSLFAISFDTLSQAALFAVAGVQLGGVGPAMTLGIVFTTGMLIADGLNGLCVARLLQGADARARIASRFMGLAVGSFSLAVAGVALARYA